MVATANLSDYHLQSCFSGYHSYRPEDNGYQPPSKPL
ncbi:BA14K family protein [Mesorhizobium australicum]|nr:BA14K family protein [Mesorhizobium sp. LNHC220B00]